MTLVVSDVDGTLVTTDKRLTAATVAAVQELRRHGIGFTLVSSRPPFGFKMLIEPLEIALPFAAFNGGMIAAPDLAVLEQHLIGEDTAREAVALLTAAGVGVWLFTDRDWVLRDPEGAYVPREYMTVRQEPVVVPDFAPYLAAAGKVVGVSADFTRLEILEGGVREALAGRASVVRSQSYYLDVTPPGTDKGTGVLSLLGRIGAGREELVVLGDMENDLPMFHASAFAIAMGNATAAVKASAQAVTRANDADGFAHAVRSIILPQFGRT